MLSGIRRVFSENEIKLITEREIPESATAGMKVHLKGPKATNELLSKFWFDVKMKSYLKREKAGLFVSFNDRCLGSKVVPQAVIFTDVKAARKNILRYLNEVDLIILHSNFHRRKLIEESTVDSSRIKVVAPVASEDFKPMNFVEKEKVKQSFSEGKEYFLCKSESHEDSLFNLLKAFSLFKKRQRSELKLLLHGLLPYPIEDRLRTYKYREDVIVIEEEEPSYPLLLAAAYALVVLEENIYTVPQAFRTATPAILPAGPLMEEVSKGAALFANNDVVDLADKLMTVYKDEKLRFEILESGKIHAEKNSIEKIAAVLSDELLSVAG